MVSRVIKKIFLKCFYNVLFLIKENKQKIISYFDITFHFAFILYEIKGR